MKAEIKKAYQLPGYVYNGPQTPDLRFDPVRRREVVCDAARAVRRSPTMRSTFTPTPYPPTLPPTPATAARSPPYLPPTHVKTAPPTAAPTYLPPGWLGEKCAGGHTPGKGRQPSPSSEAHECCGIQLLTSSSSRAWLPPPPWHHTCLASAARDAAVFFRRSLVPSAGCRHERPARATLLAAVPSQRTEQAATSGRRAGHAAGGALEQPGRRHGAAQ